MKTKPNETPTLIESVTSRLSRLFSLGGAKRPDPPAASGTDTKPRPKVTRVRRPKAVEEPAVEAGDLRRLIEEQVTANLSDPEFSVVRLAKLMKVSRTMLFTIMHDEFGITPSKYIQEQRLARSQALLDSGMRPRAVAMTCGYSDPKYFSKVFRKEYGMLPTAYYDNRHSPQGNPSTITPTQNSSTITPTQNP